MTMHAVAPNVQRYLISAVNKRAYIYKIYSILIFLEPLLLVRIFFGFIHLSQSSIPIVLKINCLHNSD